MDKISILDYYNTTNDLMDKITITGAAYIDDDSKRFSVMLNDVAVIDIGLYDNGDCFVTIFKNFKDEYGETLFIDASSFVEKIEES